MQPQIIASNGFQSPPKGMTQTFGESGTAIFNGIITGEEYNTRLQGKYALHMYDVMRRSEESVRAGLQMVKLPLIGQTDSIQAVDDTEKAAFRKRFLENQLFKRNIKWSKFKREGLTFADFGHSVCEVTYELTSFEGVPVIGVKDVGFRKQTSIQAWETQDKKPGITQMLIAPQDNGSVLRDIIRQKLIVWTNDQEGDNYEGVSLLRYAFKSWDFVDKLGLLHLIGLEKAAVPTPVLGIPNEASQADIDAAILAIQQYRSNERAYIKKPAGWELDAFDLTSQSIDQILPAMQHYEMKILLSVLGQFLMLGNSGGSGSRAVSEDHSKLFMQSEESFSKTFNEAVQDDLIYWLEYLNFSDALETGFSQLKSSAVKEDDITSLSDAMQKLQSASMITPTFETENHLRKIAKLPELPEDYVDDYQKKREMSLNPPEPKVNPLDPTKVKDPKTKAALIADLNNARSRVIDVLLR